MTRHILTCNAGSNSLKCALYESDTLTLAYHFEADRIHDKAIYTLKDADDSMLHEEKGAESGYDAALSKLLDWYKESEKGSIIAAGHRIVHGGKNYDSPVKINSNVRQALEKLVPLAPLHQPYNLKLIDILAERFEDLPQIACFDTAFHRTQPRVAQQFALPYELTEKENILRYGFHGLSYEYITNILPEHIGNIGGKRILIAHLGGGASICAIRDGQSIATSMGFTALDGLMMATRCGDLDPGVILYLLKEKGMSPYEIEELLYKKSGLLGVSGISGDMRDLDSKESKHAKQAVELFCYTAAKQLGSLITVMGGLDVLVFTGAMGSGDFFIRAQICDYLRWLGLRIDEVANAENHTTISLESSTITALALPTDEEQIIAKHTAQTLNLKGE